MQKKQSVTDRPTDRQTDRPTDGPTDTVAYRSRVRDKNTIRHTRHDVENMKDMQSYSRIAIAYVLPPFTSTFEIEVFFVFFCRFFRSNCDIL